MSFIIRLMLLSLSFVYSTCLGDAMRPVVPDVDCDWSLFFLRIIRYCSF